MVVCRHPPHRLGHGAEIVGEPVDPGNALASAEVFHQLAVQLGAADDQDQVGPGHLDRLAQPGPQIAPRQPAQQPRSLEQIERFHLASQPLERAAALGGVGVLAIVEPRHHQDAAHRHASTSAPRNWRS
jgi:hypothetical protein